MSHKHGSELGESFRSTIESSELSAALIEAGDMSLAEITEVLDGIPVLKWISAASKTFSSVRDYLFIKRMAAFLADLSALPAKERSRIMDRLDDEPQYAKRAAEAVITILERIDSPTKAIWVSRALRAYASGQIDAQQLMRLNAAIERVLVCDIGGIGVIFEHEGGVKSDDAFSQAAVVAGLGYVDAYYAGGGGVYPTETYWIFRKHILQ